MKKILATILALTLIVGMSIPAFAAEETFKTLPGTATIEVNGKYVKTSNYTDNTAVYAVDIEWTAIEFTYTVAADTYTWDAEALDYVKTSTGTTGTWSGADVDIDITNRSNAAVTVTPTWEKAENGADVVVSGAVTLGTAVGAGAEGGNAPTTNTITVSKPEAGAIGATGALGTLTLTITAAQ